MSRYNDQLEDELDIANASVASLRAEVDRLTQALAGARNEAWLDAKEAAAHAAINLIPIAQDTCDMRIADALRAAARSIRALQEPAHD